MVSLLLGDEGRACRTTERVGTTTVAREVDDFATEYRALREGCGLIDQSAGGPVRVAGTDAVDVLQRALARDIEFVPPDRAVTALLLADDGTPVDAVTVLVGETDLLVLTSPGYTDRVCEALLAAAGADADVRIVDESAGSAVFAAEGPESWRLLSEVLGADYASLAYEGALPITVADHDATIARIGVTGEYGYTFIAPADAAATLWDAFLTAGATVVGHRARESAMVEVRQPVMHREVLDGDTVLTAGLNWLVELAKDEFVGRDALQKAIAEARPEDPRSVGFVVTSGTVAVGDAATVSGTPVGTVALLVDSPSLGGQVGLLRTTQRWQASRLDFTTANGASLTTVSPPYVVPASWSIAIKPSS